MYSSQCIHVVIIIEHSTHLTYVQYPKSTCIPGLAALFVGLLAVGTSGGHVVLWQYQAHVGSTFSPKNQLDLSSKWEHVSTTSLQNPILQVKVSIMYTVNTR